MRLALIIIGFTAIALGLVSLRRQDLVVRHEMQNIDNEHEKLRPEMWYYLSEIGWLTTPEMIRKRKEKMSLDMTDDLEKITASRTQTRR